MENSSKENVTEENYVRRKKCGWIRYRTLTFKAVFMSQGLVRNTAARKCTEIRFFFVLNVFWSSVSPLNYHSRHIHFKLLFDSGK